MIKHENVNTKKTKQDYGIKSQVKSVLNRLNIMGDPTSVYTPLGNLLKETSMNVSMCPSIREIFLKKNSTCELRITEDLIKN